MITMQQFLLRQPAAPEVTETDQYYLDLANSLVKISKDKGLFKSWPEKVIERTAMAVIGYYQDVICDAGIWRSFITECRNLYGHNMPFYDYGEDYMDYELNKADVRFMVWYAMAMNYEQRRELYPYDPELLKGADEWFAELDRVYDESPMPVDYRMTHELEMHAAEDSEAIYKLGQWLFMHCYLMTPAYSLTLAEIASEFDLSNPDNLPAFQERLEQSMSQDPTGPLALFLSEWLYLIVDGKRRKPKASPAKEEHKYYTAFTKYTGGETLRFFDSYEALNRFFIDALGWAEGEEHLAQMKGNHDFILMVNREKGMLVARNIARCIAAPGNDMYDPAYAKEHAIELLTVRGVCPADLLLTVCKNGWLPDAVFPGTDDHEVVKKNWDFIARCYLQQYYTGD